MNTLTVTAFRNTVSRQLDLMPVSFLIRFSLHRIESLYQAGYFETNWNPVEPSWVKACYLAPAEVYVGVSE
jgi:hypothetical protein